MSDWSLAEIAEDLSQRSQRTPSNAGAFLCALGDLCERSSVLSARDRLRSLREILLRSLREILRETTATLLSPGCLPAAITPPYKTTCSAAAAAATAPYPEGFHETASHSSGITRTYRSPAVAPHSRVARIPGRGGHRICRSCGGEKY